ncbi:DUF2281 domain-containing protein [Gammaproteobacteria bacterium]
MNTAELIYQESSDLPETEALKVLDFVAFLKAKYQRGEDETAYLLRDPANAKDLLEAVRELRGRKQYEPRELLPDD